ncbi:MAG: hypothetical protein E7328_06525 [Clostridiales bacterium]|nr:hypothetical protein [Clostridiales bacterium]
MKKQNGQKVLMVLAVVALALCGRYFLKYLFHPADAAVAPTPAPVIQPQKTPVPKGDTITVTVLGNVENPGAYLVVKGCSVQIAIERAGGHLQGADLSEIDLSVPLYEDTLIHIP